MFGHLDLNLDDDPLFRACRCGLCHALAVEYGMKCRILTNNDLALCIWLVLSFSPTPPSTRKMICPIIARKDSVEPGEAIIRFAAASTVLLACEKLLDDELDEGRTRSRRIKNRLHAIVSKARQVLGELGFDPAPIPQAFIRQRNFEQEKDARSLESYAATTGEVLGYLYRHAAVLTGQPHHAEAFGMIGHSLGEIIYLLDSAVDYRRDLTCNAFNPLIAIYAALHRPSATPPELAIDDITTLLDHHKADISTALRTVPENGTVRQALQSGLGTCIARAITRLVAPPASTSTNNSLLAWVSGQTGVCSLSCPKTVLAGGEGGNAVEHFAGNTVGLVIMLLIFGAICRGCSNSCACGRQRRGDDRVTVDDGCGGNRTYRRDPCSGRYRSEDRGCC